MNKTALIDHEFSWYQIPAVKSETTTSFSNKLFIYFDGI